MPSSPALPSCLRFAPALATTLAALSALGVGCHGFDAAVGPPATPGAASPDDAPPLHTGGLDVAMITVGGEPVEITWLDNTRWQVEVGLDLGQNLLEIQALGEDGEVVGAGSVVLNRVE